MGLGGKHPKIDDISYNHICFCGGCMFLFPFIFVVRAKKVGILPDNSDYPYSRRSGIPTYKQPSPLITFHYETVRLAFPQKKTILFVGFQQKITLKVEW